MSSRRKSRATSEPTATMPAAADPAPPSPAAVMPGLVTAAERIRALRAALPGVDSDFLLQVFEANMTDEQARDAWVEELLARNRRAQAELAELQQRKR